ncbi:MAG: serine/threonine protein kinase [Deltaproteobacteria bacterium]|nr:serine/threonine protein kinase [Deltaproteobacteria bacterium]
MVTEPTFAPVNPALAGQESEGATDFPAPFGHYLLLHPLARGGMGNVFLAKTGGMMGIEKHCVVKTLRSRFTGDPEYVQRFVDEARVVVQLSHRNICPVFDVGRVGNSYYLAMELVIGRDVRTVHTELLERGRHMPEACALHVVCEVLDALDYAHRHTDPVSGEPLRLVHRDVSPQNVMINVEGEVKLIDFGLAEKGRPENEDSQASSQATVMGKISYMAPEHARGDPVDARSDQFSAAVVAYELLTEERYYAGLSNQEVWLTAGTGTYRAPHLDRLDPALLSILEKALAPDKNARYPSCGELREAMLGYARMRDLHAGARQLREIMGSLFVDELRVTRELLQRFAHLSSQARPGYVAPAAAPMDDAVFSIATSVHAKTINDPTEIFPSSGLYEMPPPAPKPKWPLAAAVLGVVGLAALGVTVGFRVMDPGPEIVVTTPVAQPPPPPLVDRTTSPSPPVEVKVPSPPTPEPVVARDPPPKKRPPSKKAQFAGLSTILKIDRLKEVCPKLDCTQALDKRAWVDVKMAADTSEDKAKDAARDKYAARIEQCVRQCTK